MGCVKLAGAYPLLLRAGLGSGLRNPFLGAQCPGTLVHVSPCIPPRCVTRHTEQRGPVASHILPHPAYPGVDLGQVAITCHLCPWVDPGQVTTDTTLGMDPEWPP